MKKAIIFHGTGGNPQNCWYPWLAQELVKSGYQVEVPHYPEHNKEPITTFLPKVLQNHSFDENTTLIGHSGGSPLILSILEQIDCVIPKAFLVAGYSTPPNSSVEPILQPNYDWEKIKKNVGEIFFINSLVDPYGCNADQGRTMFNLLGGTQIIMNEGHFGDYNQEYPSFEVLKKLIL